MFHILLFTSGEIDMSIKINKDKSESAPEVKSPGKTQKVTPVPLTKEEREAEILAIERHIESGSLKKPTAEATGKDGWNSGDDFSSQGDDSVFETGSDLDVVEPPTVIATDASQDGGNSSDDDESPLDTEPSPQVEEEEEDSGPVEVPDAAKDHIKIYSEKCMECKHLCTVTGKKFYNNCFYLKGNEQCPARYFKIILGPPQPVEEIAAGIARAWHKKKLKLYTKRIKEISDFDPLIQEEVLAKVNEYQLHGIPVEYRKPITK